MPAQYLTALLRMLLVAAFVSGFGNASFGATLTAASVAFSDVSNAVNLASNGDTVVIPAGSATWSNQLTISGKRLRILGAGTNSTVITEITGASKPAYVMLVDNPGIGNSSNLLVEIAYITFNTYTNVGISAVSIGNSSPTNRNFRIHDLVFTNLCTRAIILGGRAEGVVDHCVFKSSDWGYTGQGVFVGGPRVSGSDCPKYYPPPNNADVWQLGVQADTAYVEDCLFDFSSNPWMDAATSTADSARMVVRYNTIIDSNCDIHNEPNLRCSTQWEFYNNAFIENNTGRGVYVALRSGWGVCFSNTVTATVPFIPTIEMYEYRLSATNVVTAPYPCWWMTGTNRCDGNNNNVALGYPGLDMVGWGDPVTFTASNSIQTFHGCYAWSNTFNGTNVGLNPHLFGTFSNNWYNVGVYGWNGKQLANPSTALVENRDYFHYPKPGYKPLVYPHPLVSRGSTRPVTGAVDPPKRLRRQPG